MNNIISVEREIKRRYMMTFGGNGDRNFTFVAYHWNSTWDEHVLHVLFSLSLLWSNTQTKINLRRKQFKGEFISVKTLKIKIHADWK